MSEPGATCKKFWVSGRVQGVYYRASAREAARKLGLKGWIKNLPDGRVEALALGGDEAMAEFERWLSNGPAHADVSAVTSETSREEPSVEFEVR